MHLSEFQYLARVVSLGLVCFAHVVETLPWRTYWLKSTTGESNWLKGLQPQYVGQKKPLLEKDDLFLHCKW